MKTLIVLVTAGALVSSTPQVVTERLVGFSVFPPNVLRMEWDTNRDDVEDLVVFYNLTIKNDTFYTSKPFMYFQDLNFNGTYEEGEQFKIGKE